MKVLLDNHKFVVVTQFIKHGMRWCTGDVRNGIKTGLIFIKIMVKDTWIPINITCKDDMGQDLLFLISIKA